MYRLDIELYLYHKHRPVRAGLYSIYKKFKFANNLKYIMDDCACID